MRHAHQELTVRRGVMDTLSFPVWGVIGVVLAIVIGASPEAWALTVSPTAMTFQAVQGATNPPSQTFSLSRSNKRQTNWIAMDNSSWLTVSPGSGTIKRTTQVGVAVNTAGLAAGTYTATVTITVGNGGSTSVPVTLKVAPASAPPPPSTSNPTSSLSWDPVTSTNLAGYKVYVGTASGRYGTPLDVGQVTSYTMGNLTLGTTYYFVVTSYNGSGTESPYSNEVSKSIY